MTAHTSGSGYGFATTPSHLQPTPDKTLCQAVDVSPICQRFRHAVVRYQLCFSRVSDLLGFSCPSAVLRKVAFVVVNAINRVLRGRGFTHVRQKRLKVIKPSVAHRDASATVVMESMVARVMATSLHAAPSVVCLCASPSITVSVNRVPMLEVPLTNFGNGFFRDATARFNAATLQVVGFDELFTTAGANTSPMCASSVFSGWFDNTLNNSQTPKYLTGKINKFHFFTLKWLTVMGTWQAAVNSFSGATLAKQLHFSRGFA
jgi:hypothetical protein